MVKLAELFPNQTIVSALSTHLSWSHFVEIMPLDDPLKREFYAEMCRVEGWSVRTLRAIDVLQQKLRTAVERVRTRLEQNE